MSSRSGQHKDSRRILSHADGIERADSIIDRELRQIHKGRYYRHDYVFSLAASGSSGVGIDVTDGDGDLTPGHIVFRTGMIGLIGAEHEVNFYVNASFESPLSLTNPVCHNRSLPGPLPNYGFENAPAFTGGTLVYSTLVPATVAFESREWIIAKATNPDAGWYVEIINLSASSAFVSTVSIELHRGTGVEATAP